MLGFEFMNPLEQAFITLGDQGRLVSAHQSTVAVPTAALLRDSKALRSTASVNDILSDTPSARCAWVVRVPVGSKFWANQLRNSYNPAAELPRKQRVELGTE
jgi:hypothetical protein